MDCNTGIALGFYKAVHREVKACHNQFKLLGRIDDHIAIDIGNAFALCTDSFLINDLFAFILIGIFRQDVKLKTIGNMVGSDTGCINNNITVVFAGTNHNGNVLAVGICSCKGIFNSFVDCVFGFCPSGSDVCVISGIVRSIVIVFLQGGKLFLCKFLLHIFRRRNVLGGTFDYDVIRNR